MINKLDLEYNKLSGILQKCCDSPDIIFIESGTCLDKRLYCKSCGLIVASMDRLVDLCNKWNDRVMERKRSERVIAEVEVYKYPFVLAMK